MIGVPGFIGFWSKFYIVSGCIQSNNILATLVFLLSSFLNVVYLLPIPFIALKSSDHNEDYKENYFCAIPLLITALFTIILGLVLIHYLLPFYRLVEVLYVKQ